MFRLSISWKSRKEKAWSRKSNTLCDQIYEDIQNLRESGNYDVEKRLGVEIMALNALSNAYAKTGQNLVHPADAEKY